MTLSTCIPNIEQRFPLEPNLGGNFKLPPKLLRHPPIVVWTFFFGLFSLPLFAQPLFTFDEKTASFSTDQLQNIYLQTTDHQLVKINAVGREEFRYTNKTLGAPAHLDASNPFQPLLFYPDFQTVVALDRTMSETGRLDLLRAGFFRVNAVGRASDNGLWLYDEATFRLKKLAPDGSLLLESADLSLSLGQAVAPDFLLEREQFVFLSDPAQGVFIFDIFGKFLKKLPLIGLREFQVEGQKLFFFQTGMLWAFDLQSLLTQPVQLPEGALPADHLRLEKGRVYVLQNEKLRVFSL